MFSLSFKFFPPFLLLSSFLSMHAEAKTWSCLCYDEMIKGRKLHVTNCRESFDECQKLESAVWRGTSTLVAASVSKSCRNIIAEMPWNRMGTIADWKPSQKEGTYWSTHGCLIKEKNLVYIKKHGDDISASSENPEDNVKLYFSILKSELVGFDYEQSTEDKSEKVEEFSVDEYSIKSSKESTLEEEVELSTTSTFGFLTRKGQSATISIERSNTIEHSVSNSVQQSLTRSREKSKTRSHSFGAEVGVEAKFGFLMAETTVSAKASYNHTRSNTTTDMSSSTYGSEHNTSNGQSNSSTLGMTKGLTHEIESNEEFSISYKRTKTFSDTVSLIGDIPGDYQATLTVVTTRNLKRNFVLTVQITAEHFTASNDSDEIKKQKMSQIQTMHYLKNVIDLNAQRIYSKDGNIYAELAYSEVFDQSKSKTKISLVKPLRPSDNLSQTNPTKDIALLKDSQKESPKDSPTISAIKVVFSKPNSQVFIDDIFVARSPNIVLKKVIPNLTHIVTCVSEDGTIKKHHILVPMGRKKKVTCH